MIEIKTNRKPVREISLIPLINIIFLLLVYFLVVGAIERFDVLEVTPPIAESSEELDQGTMVIILGRNNEVLINDEMLTVADVFSHAEDYIQGNETKVITIKADAAMEASRLIEVIEELRKAGAKHITLATRVV